MALEAAGLNFKETLTSNTPNRVSRLTMRNLLVGLLAAAALSFAPGGMALADTDPTVHQIYEAASSGRLDQAQQMMDQVLRDHPNSAKAHYVQSELYAREGKFSLARAELDRAEQLEPGLPKENPRSVAELKSELGLTRRADPSFGETRESASHFPWVTVVIFALVVGVIWMLFRRRTRYMQYPGGAPTVTPGTYGPGGYGPGGPVGGGIGSTVAGGLAGGLAAGAGIVAGEALAHRLLDGGHSSTPPTPATDDGEPNAANSAMGGADFGVNDPGSWDDGSGVGGGGDDWT
jgi:tetratricopeptide (TPR) repeat protein